MSSSNNQYSELSAFANKYNTQQSLQSNANVSNNTATTSLLSNFTDRVNGKIPLFSASNSTQPLISNNTTALPVGNITSANNSTSTTTQAQPIVTSTSSSVFSRVSDWWQGNSDHAQPDTQLNVFGCIELSWTQRIIGFVMSLIFGFIFLSFTFLYLPSLLVGGAAKFSISYGMTNVCFLLSTCFLVGPLKQIQSMMSEGRWIASIIYVITLSATLYTSYAIRSFYIVLPILCIQILSLLYYLFTLLPGGYANTMMLKVINGIFGGLWRSGRSLLPI